MLAFGSRFQKSVDVVDLAFNVVLNIFSQKLDYFAIKPESVIKVIYEMLESKKISINTLIRCLNSYSNIPITCEHFMYVQFSTKLFFCTRQFLHFCIKVTIYCFLYVNKFTIKIKIFT